jgi:uncharacterized protein (DUF2141 family)
MRWGFAPLLATVTGSLALLTGAAQAQGPPAPNCHGQPSPYRLLIDVEGVKSNWGSVVANIYGPDKQKFLADNGWLYVWDDPAQRGSQTMCMYLPHAGQYEAVMFHDANGNGVLDQGIFGVPIEGYGFSNNVRPHFHAPSMSSAAFLVSEGDTHLRIRLHYP